MTKTVGAALLVATLSFSPAHAVVIGFDDLQAPVEPIGSNYQGFTWSNTWFVASETSVTLGPGDQTISGSNFAWSDGVHDLSLSSSSAFNFDSFYARKAFARTPGTITVLGFEGDKEIYNVPFLLTTEYQKLSLNFQGITRWKLVSPRPTS